MAIYIQLQTGRTVKVNSIIEALDFDYQEAIARNTGSEINDPFTEFIEEEIHLEEIENIEEIPLEELDEDF